MPFLPLPGDPEVQSPRPEAIAAAADLAVLSLPNGLASTLVPELLSRGVRVVDLSANDPKWHDVPSSAGRPRRGIGSLAWSPRGRLLAVGLGDGRVELLDLSDLARPRTVAQIVAHAGPVHAIAWSQSGRELIAADGSQIGRAHV